MPGVVEIVHELSRGQHAVWKQSGSRGPPNIDTQTQRGVGQNITRRSGFASIQHIKRCHVSAISQGTSAIRK